MGALIDSSVLIAAERGELDLEGMESGQTVGAHDLIIAATALARGLDVVTQDESSFPRIAGLSVIRW